MGDIIWLYVFTCLCEILCFIDESSSHVELYPECIWRHGNAVSRMNGITGTCHHTAGRGGGRGCGDVQEEDERAKVEETTREAKCTQDLYLPGGRLSGFPLRRGPPMVAVWEDSVNDCFIWKKTIVSLMSEVRKVFPSMLHYIHPI